MSRNGTARLNPRRDANEPALKAYVERMGYEVMQVSGKGRPDWVLMRSSFTEHKWLVDVKTKDGHFKPAQVDQWTAWADKGINVYIVRKTADIDALLRGELRPWKPSDAAPKRKPKAHKPGVSKARAAGDLCHADFCPTSKAFGSTWCTKHGPRDAPIAVRTRLGTPVRKAYLPPQTTRPDASALAAETFAPPTEPCDCIGRPHTIECMQGVQAPLRCGCTIEMECAKHSRGEA